MQFALVVFRCVVQGSFPSTFVGHPSNRTLVHVLRLGGAKRRFILAAARHSCGACEAQKRPAGPIVSRSHHSFVFGDVVGLDLFLLNTYEKHTLPAMNIVRWGTDLQRVFPCGTSRERP